MKRFTLSVLAVSGALFSSAFAAEGWLTDLEAAKKQAAEEKKDLLVDFTGSDWCHWCQQLKSEVFDEKAFKDAAPKNFVLVELDFPNRKKLPEEQQKANEELRVKFGVEGFPTILLLDGEGRPYAQTGYQEGGAKEYLKHLDELREHRAARDEAFAKAAKLEGLDRAKALAKGLSNLSESLIITFYSKEADAIIEADKENKTELPKKLQAFREQKQTQDALREMLEKPEVAEFQKKIEAALSGLETIESDKQSEEGRNRLDALIAKEKPEGFLLQMALFTRMSFLPDLKDAPARFDEIIKADEKSPLGLKAISEKAQVMEMLKGVDKSKDDGAAEEPEPENEKDAEKEAPAEKEEK